MFGPFCPCGFISGALGGLIGGYLFGIYPPKDPSNKIKSIVLSSTLVGITFFALKTFANIPLCGQGTSLPSKVIVVILKGTALGTFYSIFINYCFQKIESKTPLQNSKGKCCGATPAIN